MAGKMKIWSRISGFFRALELDRAATAPRLEHTLRSQQH